MSKTYKITRLPAGTGPSSIDWNRIPAARVSTYKWVRGYAPAVMAKLAYVEGECFVLHMVCGEERPLVTYHEYNRPVYKDSCMEFFAIWDAESDRYVNMEMNAAGTLLSSIGADRHERTPVLDVCGEIFPVKGEILSDAWSVTATIPLSMIATLYGTDTETYRSRLVPGYTLRGNFYKCGDETPIPHFGMWNEVGTTEPDFHRPEFFGDLVLT